MALVNLKDVRVSRLNNTGLGFTVLEENVSGGKTYKTYYKVWPKEEHGLAEGDVINVSGFLGAKVNTWTNKEGNEKHSVELSINSPRMTDGDRSQPPAEEPWAASAPAGDVWNQPTSFDQETPF